MHLSRNCPFSNKTNLHLELPGLNLSFKTVASDFCRCDGDMQKGPPFHGSRRRNVECKLSGRWSQSYPASCQKGGRKVTLTLQSLVFLDFLCFAFFFVFVFLVHFDFFSVYLKVRRKEISCLFSGAPCFFCYLQKKDWRVKVQGDRKTSFCRKMGNREVTG